jgi:hypothetical protein
VNPKAGSAASGAMGRHGMAPGVGNPRSTEASHQIIKMGQEMIGIQVLQ